MMYVPHGASTCDHGCTYRTGNGQWVSINSASELTFLDFGVAPDPITTDPSDWVPSVAGSRPTAAIKAPPKPKLKPSCGSGAALWAGLKAAANDFFSPPGADPMSDVGDALRDKNVQRAAVGTLYVVANAARSLAPAAEVAADLIPFVGEGLLIYQGGKALYEGGKAYKESIDRCYGGD
jgi:hypothetical protein